MVDRVELEKDSREEVVESHYEYNELLKRKVKELKEQNKHYQEALSFVELELYEVLHENVELNVKMIRIENAKRMITKVLNEEDEE